jgi:uncharacterized protein
MDVTDNTKESRFEIKLGDEMAIAEYVKKDGVISFTHTLVPEHLRGKGTASQLAKFALDKAKAEGLKVDPRCPFFADYIRKNPEYQPLLAT